MEILYITIHTKQRDSFLWREGYTKITNIELETLLQQSRDIITSLKTEIRKQQLQLPSSYSNRNNKCHEKLHKMAKKLKIRDHLDNQASKHINTTIEILTKPQTDYTFKVYQEFLYDILRHYSPKLVILYTISLRK